MHISAPPRVAVGPKRSRAGAIATSNSQTIARLSTYGAEEDLDDEEPTTRVEDQQELLSDEQDVNISPRSAKKMAAIKSAAINLGPNISPKGRGDKGASSIGGVKNKIATASKTRIMNSRGKSGRDIESKMAISTQDKSPSDPPEKLYEQSFCDDSPTNNDQSFQSAIQKIAKLQRELDAHARREKEQNEEIRACREKAKEQARVIEGLQNAKLENSQFQDNITDLQSKLLVETDEKTFWIRKCQEAHRDYSKSESELRLLRAELAEREASLKDEQERRTEQLLIDRDRCRERYHTAQKALQEREAEVLELRQQLLGLKRNISTWTKTEGQIADDVFRERFTSLGHDLQNWTINNFRRAKLGKVC